MSAYQCSETHIGALARKITDLISAPDLGRYLRRTGTDDDIFNILAEENTKSLHARYPDIALDDTAEWHNPVTQSKALYDYPLLTDAEAFAAVRGYDYQACEHEDYLGSEARRLVEELKAEIVDRNLSPDFIREREMVKSSAWDIGDDFGRDRPQGPISLMQMVRAKGIEL